MSERKRVSQTEKIYYAIGRRLENYPFSDNKKVKYLMFLVQGYCLSKYNRFAFDDYIFVHKDDLRIPGREIHHRTGKYLLRYDLADYQDEAIDIVLKNILDVKEEELVNAIHKYPIIKEIHKRKWASWNPDWYQEIDYIEMMRFFKEHFDEYTKEEVIHPWKGMTQKEEQSRKFLALYRK